MKKSKFQKIGLKYFLPH